MFAFLRRLFANNPLTIPEALTNLNQKSDIAGYLFEQGCILPAEPHMLTETCPISQYVTKVTGRRVSSLPPIYVRDVETDEEFDMPAGVAKFGSDFDNYLHPQLRAVEAKGDIPKALYFLASIGDPDKIARYLKHCGYVLDEDVALRQGRNKVCPVALFLKKETGIDALRVTRFGVLKDTPNWDEYEHPFTVAQFVDRFDNGDYPELGSGCFAPTAGG